MTFKRAKEIYEALPKQQEISKDLPLIEYIALVYKRDSICHNREKKNAKPNHCPQ